MESVKISLDRLTIKNTTSQYADGICRTVRRAFHVDLNEECDDCMKPHNITEQVNKFPEGQFVAVYEDDDEQDIVLGMAATMRTSRSPSDKSLSWMDAIGGLNIPNHDPDGEWLYGVEMAVRPMYHRNGIGTRLYEARFELVKKINLRGWYAVGMLMGYENHADEMDVVTYGNKVIAGEIYDPTVSMQINRGFRPDYVVTDYLDEPPAGDAGVLIVWDNPEYKEG